MYVGGYLLSPKNKNQHTASRSSAEAEYIAITHTTCKLVWLRHILSELGFAILCHMKIIYDNQATLHIALNPVFHELTKDIKIVYHFVRKESAISDKRRIT